MMREKNVLLLCSVFYINTKITTFYMKTQCKHCLGPLNGAFKTLFLLQKLGSTTYLLTVSFFSLSRFPLCPVSNCEESVFEEANKSVCSKNMEDLFSGLSLKCINSL